MKKRFYGLLLLISMLLLSFTTVFAKNSKVVDEQGIISDSTEDTLSTKLDKMSKKYKMDIVIVTMDSLDGKSAMEYADDFYDYKGYGQGSQKSGMLLLVRMADVENPSSTGDNDIWISTTGRGIKMFTEYDVSRVENLIVPYLKNGDYDTAFMTFVDETEKILSQRRMGLILTLPLAIIIGLVIALIVNGIRASKLKSVVRQLAANEYTRPNSMVITNSYENFIRREVHRHRVENSSGGGGGTHTGSSGTSHGGGGGKF